MIPLDLRGPPSRWVVRGGRPADVVMDYSPSPGLPSYESENGVISVFDVVIANVSAKIKSYGSFAGATEEIMFLPRSYGSAAVRDVLAGGEGLCCLYDDPDAMWTWRPLLYRITLDGMQRMGSQEELAWRFGLVGAFHHQAADVADRLGIEMPQRDGVLSLSEIDDANLRADVLLLQHLEWWQAFDWAAWGYFFVKGEVNKLYKIRVGDGFEIVDPVTLEPLVSFCLHPETWMPSADVALAQVLLLREGAEGEEELLSGARPTVLRGRTREQATRNEIRAYELECELRG